MSEIEIVPDGGRRRHWTAYDKLHIIEETLDAGASTSVIARRNGVVPNLLYRWRSLMLAGGRARRYGAASSFAPGHSRIYSEW